MRTANGRLAVPIEPIREILEEAARLHERAYQKKPTTGYRDGVIQLEPRSGLEAVAEEIALYTGRTTTTIVRQLFAIRAGWDTNRGKRYPRRTITLRFADEILCALGMQERWYTDPRLREVYEQIGAGDADLEERTAPQRRRRAPSPRT